MTQRPDWRHVTITLVFLAAVVVTATLPRTAWPEVLGAYALAFIAYTVVIARWGLPPVRLRYWIAVAVLARFLMLFCFPNLSDDIYRFIWDAEQTLQGTNPYDVVPSEVIPADSSLRQSGIYPALNSPDYHTVYPPIGQGLFALASLLGGLDWFTFALVLKLFFLAAECLTIRIMYQILKRKGQSSRVLIYALNPLVIVELVGNVHLEAFVILGLVLAIYYLEKRKLAGVAAGFALGIGAKLLPAMLVPLLVRRLPIRRFIWLTIMLGTACLVLFLPMLRSDLLAGAGSSINLYFQKFEFNASLYYIARWIGYQLEGYNLIATIGPLLAGLTVLIVAMIVAFERGPHRSNFARAAMFGLTAYLLLATTVHPWYVCPLVALCVFTRYRYAVAWSAVVFVSYAAYRTPAYDEDLLLIAISYLVVLAWLAFEIRKFTRHPRDAPAIRDS
ncbi:MAG: hypothetical protein R3301_07700 [Saprospiraceae bacterium]|nr:hypothetical protein [Saprospiraceae bacterium]